MGAAAVPIVLAVSSAIGLGAQAYQGKRQRDQMGDAKDDAKAERERLAAQGREADSQARLTEATISERRRERAKGLVAQGRQGTIKTTPGGVIGSGAMGGRYKIGA